MKYHYFLGIDNSKLTFDYALIDGEGEILFQGKCTNQIKSIQKWLKELKETLKGKKVLICMEHSGYYSAHLLKVLDDFTLGDIWVESALRIKRSIGLQRGKSDKVDALRIASYSLDFQRKARLWEPSNENIEQLGLLISHRDRLVKNLQSISNPLHEEEDFVKEEFHVTSKVLTSPVIEALKKAIEGFNNQIKELLNSDVEIARQTEIVTSIPGFGQVIASKLIEVTHGFTRLTDPRRLACYSGVAPFEHTSGTSIKGRTRISHIANKDIKKMLHLAALVTIRKGNIMYDYYHRKVKEGKPPMAVINAIRNKLIHILMACIRKNVTYQKNYQPVLV